MNITEVFIFTTTHNSFTAHLNRNGDVLKMDLEHSIYEYNENDHNHPNPNYGKRVASIYQNARLTKSRITIKSRCHLCHYNLFVKHFTILPVKRQKIERQLRKATYKTKTHMEKHIVDDLTGMIHILAEHDEDVTFYCEICGAFSI